MPLIFLAWQDDTGQAVMNLCSLHGAEWQDNYDYSENLACQVRLFSISAAVGEKKGELSEMYTLKLSF